MAEGKQGDRKFYDLPKDQLNPKENTISNDPKTLAKYINDNIIGRDVTFEGPFGRRRVVYCDYIASGKSLKFIEDFINKEVRKFKYSQDLNYGLVKSNMSVFLQNYVVNIHKGTYVFVNMST